MKKEVDREGGEEKVMDGSLTSGPRVILSFLFQGLSP